jgi:sugar/nucleoside kinase (ribokinase family)
MSAAPSCRSVEPGRRVTDVVCLGILVADAIARPVDELPPSGSLGLVDEITLRGGGCGLNTATVLARLGLDAALIGKVGADPFGDFLRGLAEERGLGREGILSDPNAATSATVVLVDRRGERTFLHLPGANGHLRADELDQEALYAGQALHLAGALVMASLDGEPAARILAEAKRRGILTSLDTVWDPNGRWELVLPALPHVDVFSPSLDEGRAIAGLEEPRDVAGWLRERGPGTVALTMGDRGAYVAGDDFEGLVPAYPVASIDGTGSGDAFSAGLLYGVLEEWPLERSARLANAVGALATTSVGASEGVKGLEGALALAGLA